VVSQKVLSSLMFHLYESLKFLLVREKRTALHSPTPPERIGNAKCLGFKYRHTFSRDYFINDVRSKCFAYPSEESQMKKSVQRRYAAPAVGKVGHMLWDGSRRPEKHFP